MIGQLHLDDSVSECLNAKEMLVMGGIATADVAIFLIYTPRG